MFFSMPMVSTFIAPVLANAGPSSPLTNLVLANPSEFGVTNPPSRSFSLRHVMSITTLLYFVDDMQSLRDVVRYLANEGGMTDTAMLHWGKRCQQWILTQYPELAGIEIPEEITDERVQQGWFDTLESRYGEELELTPIPGSGPAHTLEEAADYLQRAIDGKLN